MEQIDFINFTSKLQYEFNNKSLLEEALRHSSFVNELATSGLHDNERFEFLGDAVLNLVVGHILMDRYPEINEGDLSRMRANLVNESQLASIAGTLDLGSYIKLGKGEIQTNGRNKKSILADTLEAVIASVYLDGGFDEAFRIIAALFAISIDSVITLMANNDYKSQIQELAQLTYRAIPLYTVLNESGPDHDKTFVVHLKVHELQTEGVGKSKKMAEQDAARKALEILKEK